MFEGMMVIVLGEGYLVLVKVVKVEKFLDKFELIILLMVQVVELVGDCKKVEVVYKKLVIDDWMWFVGVCGLML